MTDETRQPDDGSDVGRLADQGQQLDDQGDGQQLAETSGASMPAREDGGTGAKPRGARRPARRKSKLTSKAAAEANGHAADDDDSDKPLSAGRLSGFKQQRIKWVAEPRFPAGELLALVGRKTSGKSCLVAAFLAAVTTKGKRFPGRKASPPADVLWATTEDDPIKTLRPRIEANGGDPDRVHFVGYDDQGNHERSLVLPADFEELEALIVKHGAKVLVLDPIADFVAPGANLDTEQGARPILRRLLLIARRTGCLIIVVRHPRKGTTGERLEDCLGTTAFTAVPRVVLCIFEPEQLGGRRVLKLVAGNLWPKPKPLPFDLVDRDGAALVKFFPEIEPDDPRLEPKGREDGSLIENRTVEGYLREQLADGKWRDPKSLIEHCVSEFKLSPSTVYRKASNMGIESKIIGKGKERKSSWRIKNGSGQEGVRK